MSAVVADGASDDFTISFHPVSAGTKSTTITITSNDPADDLYTFRVRGNAVAEAPIRRLPVRVSFSAEIGRMDFRSTVGKTYRITTSRDLITYEPIPGLSGIVGTGEMIAADLSAYLPSEIDPTRYFRLEEE